MSISFNADEILEMALEIERNGIAFYRKAAADLPDPKAKDLMESLASMEEDHERTFARMKQRVAEERGSVSGFDPMDEASRYLRAMADGHVFDLRQDPGEFGADRDEESILRAAIGLEKDSIVFYLGLKDMVPAHLGRDWVETIIEEEMGHIGQLSERIRNLGT